MKLQKLSLTVAFLLAIGTNAHADLNDGLVAHWNFDDCKATDVSGNGHDGTINGNPQCVAGVKNGMAFSFDGKSDYINAGNSQLFNVNNHSIATWVKSSVGGILVGKVNPLTYESINLVLNWENFKLHTSFATDYEVNHVLESVKTIADNQWHFVAMSYDGAFIRFYIDGIIDSSYPRAGTVRTNGNELAIGRHGGDLDQRGGGEGLFNGVIDELRIYNRALSEAEVMELYNGGGIVEYTNPMPPPITAQTGTVETPVVAGGVKEEKENIVGSLCGITNKTHQTDMLKLVEVDMTNSLIFPSSVDVVSNYRTLLTQKNIANKTTKQLYSQIYSLEKKNKKLLSETMGSITAKDGKAWSNFLKSAEVSEKINKLSADRAIAVDEYNILKTELKNTPSPSFINKAGTVTSGLLTAYGTACGLYEMYEDVSNIIGGNDLAYDTLNLSWHAINVAGGSLSLWELVTNVPNATSKVLSRSAAFLLVPQVVALGYEWARDNTLYDQVNNILKTHSNTLELRYFMVDQIVDELAKYRTETPLDNLRYSLMTILAKYPNVYRNDRTLFDADKEFISFLSNKAFLQKNFGKSQYEKLTPPELASVAAVYILGEAATWENMTLKTTTIKNLTKMPVWNKPSTWGDILPAAFNGKDSFTIFSDLRTQVITALNYNVYDNLRNRFDSSFVKQRISLERQIGEKIHYYEQF